jgi:hypothetical protein
LEQHGQKHLLPIWQDNFNSALVFQELQYLKHQVMWRTMENGAEFGRRSL